MDINHTCSELSKAPEVIDNSKQIYKYVHEALKEDLVTAESLTKLLNAKTRVNSMMDGRHSRPSIYVPFIRNVLRLTPQITNNEEDFYI